MEATSLAALIREHQDRTGDTYQTIATKCGLSKSRIGDLARGERIVVRSDTLDKLARGLHIPRAVVHRAALGTSGFIERELEHTTLGIEDGPTRPLIAAIVDQLKDLDEDRLSLVADIVAVVAAR